MRTRGSDSVAIQDISATDFDEYREVNELILNVRKSCRILLVATGAEEKCYDTVVISKAADAMLAMSGVKRVLLSAK